MEEIAKKCTLIRFFDLSLSEDFKTNTKYLVLNMEDGGVAELLVNDGTLISLSDSRTHNALLRDAGYAMYFLPPGFRIESFVTFRYS